MAKATKKQALGRGLSALLKDPENDIQSAKDKNADKVIGNIVELELDQIEMNPFQPRTNFNEESLRELASSIRELGVIQPITVRKLGFEKYQLVSGERRFRASKLVGLETVPAYIRIANDQESLEMALVENIQRQDLDPIEIALSYQRLIDEINLTQEQMSERVGKKRSTIANYLRLLKLDPIIQTGMRDGFLSMGHGRAIINIEDQNIQLEIYEKILSDKLSVRQTENLVKIFKNKKVRVSSSKDTNIIALELSISNKIGLNVDIQNNTRNKGKISFEYKDLDQLNKIIDIIKSNY